MIINTLDEVADLLTDFGLTPDEAQLYCFLIIHHSATAREIYQSMEFRRKQRSNLYKVIEKLQSKQFIMAESKGEKQRFYPIEPELILAKKIDEITDQLQILKSKEELIIHALHEHQERSKSEFQLPQKYKELIQHIIPSEWRIKEAPEIKKLPELGLIHSIEFDTPRRFGAHSAGVVIHEFPYPEHRNDALHAIHKFQLNQMTLSLENYRKQSPLKILKWRFNSSMYPINNDLSLVYTQISIRLAIPGKFYGGMTTLGIQENPQILLSLWAADERDFKIMLHTLTQSFLIDPMYTELYRSDINAKKTNSNC